MTVRKEKNAVFRVSVDTIGRRKEKRMKVVFVEPRPNGKQEGSPIGDYVVEDHVDHALGTFKTQEQAIAWSKHHGHTPHVARVRHLNDKKKPDHWRAV
jgi:hypothetical protein